MTGKGFFERAGLFVRSWLSGEKCAVCGERGSAEGGVVCRACGERLDAASRELCTRCRRRVGDCLCVKPGMEDAGCAAFIKLYFYSHEDGAPQNRLIYRLKTRKDSFLCRESARLLAPKLLEYLRSSLVLPDEAVICPVPRSRKAKSENGTDQARELAKALAAETRSAYCEVLTRLRDGLPQKGLDAAARRENVAGMFAPAEGTDLSGFTAVIVDDVVTTGATVCECAKALKAAGAQSVVCVALASDE